MVTITETKAAEQNKRGRGGGSIYKKYRTADGKLRESRFWSIKYYKHGVRFAKIPSRNNGSLQNVCSGNGSAKLTPVCLSPRRLSGCFTRI
jgi:hypothetical protein